MIQIPIINQVPENWDDNLENIYPDPNGIILNFNSKIQNENPYHLNKEKNNFRYGKGRYQKGGYPKGGYTKGGYLKDKFPKGGLPKGGFPKAEY